MIGILEVLVATVHRFTRTSLEMQTSLPKHNARRIGKGTVMCVNDPLKRPGSDAQNELQIWRRKHESSPTNPDELNLATDLETD